MTSKVGRVQVQVEMEMVEPLQTLDNCLEHSCLQPTVDEISNLECLVQVQVVEPSETKDEGRLRTRLVLGGVGLDDGVVEPHVSDSHAVLGQGARLLKQSDERPSKYPHSLRRQPRNQVQRWNKIP